MEYEIRLVQLQHLITKTDVDKTPFKCLFMDHSSTTTLSDEMLTELGIDPTFPGANELLQRTSAIVNAMQRDQPGPFFDQR